MRQSFNRIPVRWRISVMSALVTFLILLGFAVLIGQSTAENLSDEFDNKLLLAATSLQNQLRVQQGVTGAIRVGGVDLEDFARPEDAAVRVVVPSGTVLATTKSAPPLGTPQSDPVTVVGFRVVSRPLSVPLGFPTIWVQYGRRTADLDSTIRRTWLFLLIGVVGGTALALVGGWAVARRAMRPIAGLTKAADKIAKTRNPDVSLPASKARDEVTNLAKTLQEMLSSLAAARGEAELLLKQQQRFIADASHELRTPLTSILANLELLDAELAGDRQTLEVIKAAIRSSVRMSELISDLLILARADSGQHQRFSSVDLCCIAQDVVAELQPLKKKGQHLALSLPEAAVCAYGDKSDLHRLLRNLTENAIRHTPDGTLVEIGIVTGNGSVKMTVADNGPGIPSELRRHIFDRFYHDSSGGGSGLGLAIAKSIAAAHGGVVVLVASEGGTSFRCTLPQSAD